jgi:hypothetical protein
MPAARAVPQSLDLYVPTYEQPEIALLKEILRQAVRDIVDMNLGKRCAAPHFKRSAQRWIENNDNLSDETGYTFVRVCEELNLDPAFVRQEIKVCIAELSLHEATPSAPRRTGRLTNVRYSKKYRLEREQSAPTPSATSAEETIDLPASGSSSDAE